MRFTHVDLRRALGHADVDLVPPGWCIAHYDFRRDVFTLERTRRWFKGRFWIVGGERLYWLSR
jgi:hypothetical protein